MVEQVPPYGVICRAELVPPNHPSPLAKQRRQAAIAGVLVVHALVEPHLAEIHRRDPARGFQPGEGGAETLLVEYRRVYAEAEQRPGPGVGLAASPQPAASDTRCDHRRPGQ